MVAYNNEKIVGARQYEKGEILDIPIMGYDNSTENTQKATEGYCLNGDIPLIKIHRENGDIIEMKVTVVEGSLEFSGSVGHSKVILTEK